MSKITIIFLAHLLLILNLQAKEITVNALENGNCWIQTNSSSEAFGLRLVSFPSDQATQIDAQAIYDLRDEIERFLVQNRIDVPYQQGFPLYAKCSYAGLALRLAIEVEDYRLCFHLNLGTKKDRPLVIGQVYSNYETYDTVCSGQKPGSLLLSIDRERFSQQEIDHCIGSLKQNLAEHFAITNQKSTTHWITYTLQTNRDYLYKEFLVKEMILADSICQDLINKDQIEFNTIMDHVGTVQQITKINFN